MTVDEAARLHLYEGARDCMDEDAAKTLLAGLPWDADRMATKDDLERLGLQIDSRADRRLLQLVLTIVGLYIAIAALMLAVIQAVR